MQISRLLFVAAILLFVFAAQSFGTEGADCTRGIDIACIQTYHDVIAPSCHKYMPAKDYATVRQHVPNMVTQAATIADLKLDSTFAPVAEAFEKERRLFLAAVDQLMVAAEGTDDEVFAEAFDKMHEAFARMASSLVPSPVELDEFHAIVAQVWHELLPNKDYAGIKAALPALRGGCKKLASAKLNESQQEIKDEYLAAVGKVESSIDDIEKVIDSKSDEKIEESVVQLHESFRSVMALF
ncbi:MAG: hypothetical protein KKH67_12925 [candidate division Zixibacteria bacterium]|nr:hypothetical protein [candidate division Zixibacteria bacterium]MBU1471881.1 hypothetical protein [candidate division Zixibacteria bacterium]